MKKHQKKSWAPSHRDRHDHQQVGFDGQELHDESSLPGLSINHATYNGDEVPRNPQLPENTGFNYQEHQQSSQYMPELHEGGSSEHGYVFEQLDQAANFDLDQDDLTDLMPYSTPATTGYGHHDDRNFNQDMTEGIEQSANQVYQPYDPNQPSTSAPPIHIERMQAYQNSASTALDEEQHVGLYSSFGGLSVPPSLQLSPQAAQTGYRGQPNNRQFTVTPSTQFRLGTVFKVNWVEPRGSGGAAETLTDGGDDPYFSGIRRFIVVKEARGHSVCVGLYTYGQRGCLKRGVHPEDHAQAYDERLPVPPLLPEEPALGAEPFPISILPQLPYETIDSKTRINLAKLHTVNHNVPISIIGSVAPEHHQYLRQCINTIWGRQDVPRHYSNKNKGKWKEKDRRR